MQTLLPLTANTLLEQKKRVVPVLAGALASCITVPFLMRTWAPTWFLAAWGLVYASLALTFVSLIYRRPSAQLETLWSICSSAMFAAVAVSTITFDANELHYWIATTTGLMFVALRLAILPLLQTHEWRTGPIIVGLALIVAGFMHTHWAIPIAIVPIVAGLLASANLTHVLKATLETHLGQSRKAASCDPVTGLHNRRGLAEIADQLNGRAITVVLIDLDRFKLINDSYGHDVGDEVLIDVAKQLERRLQMPFSLARLGGDEFVAVAEGHLDLAPRTARPITVNANQHGHALRLDCALSLGITHGTPTETFERLLLQADFAMREAKRTGGGIRAFDDDLAWQLQRSTELAGVGSGSPSGGRFVPYAQAIVSDQGLVGCELLVRWQHPEGELLCPAEFLSMAQATGQLAAINELMLQHAVGLAHRLGGPDAPFVSVNMNASHLLDSGLADRVKSLLTINGVSPHRLLIEVTETEQLASPELWAAAAAELRKIGVTLAMDDFGTGYSSMDRMQYLPISYLKFDRSLVRSASGLFGEIVRGVVRFSDSLDIKVIAEGVETVEEYERMQSHGVRNFQGYLFHRPEPLHEFEQRVADPSSFGSALCTGAEPASLLPPTPGSRAPGSRAPGLRTD